MKGNGQTKSKIKPSLNTINYPERIKPEDFAPVLFQLSNSDIAKLNSRVVAEEADVSLIALQAGVVPSVHCPRRAGLVDIRIDDCCAIEFDCDLPAFRGDFLIVPLTHRLEVAAFGGNDTVNGTVILIGLEIFVYVGGVIQNL